MVPAAVDPRRVACRLLVAAVVRLILAAAVRLWFREELFSAPVLEAPAVSAKEQAMADRRPEACHLPVVSRWAAPDRETEWLAD